MSELVIVLLPELVEWAPPQGSPFLRRALGRR